jgi:hypothetical protein
MDVNSSGIIVGGEGQLNILVRNSGSDDGSNTVFFIKPVGQSPIVPYQDSVYAGDFPIDATIPLSYKISVDSNADPSLTYPVEIWAVYTDYQGITTQSATKSFGAGFGPKIQFVVTSQPAVVHAGAQDVIKVTYRNTGQTTAYNAQANINIVDPFSSEDDQSYLGTLASGESATAEFKLATTGGSTAKEYALDCLGPHQGPGYCPGTIRYFSCYYRGSHPDNRNSGRHYSLQEIPAELRCRRVPACPATLSGEQENRRPVDGRDIQLFYSFFYAGWRSSSYHPHSPLPCIHLANPHSRPL